MSSEPVNTDEDGVLSPDELRLDDERVDRLGENRYVIRPDRSETDTLEGTPDRGHSSLDDGFTTAIAAVGDVPATDESSAAIGASEPDVGGERSHAGAAPRHAGAVALESVPDPHGIDVTLKTDGELAHLTVTSHDVREVFVELLSWYANQLDDDLTPAQALEVMLATCDLDAPR
ncbi:DUF7500 family protein [Natronobiforma cellulositropha]|uniref:DUF7500 family protein n=1 Tax=Natronobiforma cellulositropha TaxID=1679076 RepID=UPI0021D5E120|nr:hypothetical protein [Natronobiforma cellulositropha]